MTQYSNQRVMSVEVGKIDLAINPSIISAYIASTETATLVPGSPVKMADVAGGVPKVLLATADTDGIFGYIVRNPKDASYVAGDACEIALAGSVMYMEAGAAIARGAVVEADVSEVTVITAAGVNPTTGIALDKAAASGDLVRVLITVPVSSDAVYAQSVFDYDDGAGALPLTARNIYLTTGGAEALTLADGIEGQRLTIVMVVDGGAGTLTPANYLNGTTLRFDDVGDSAELVFLNGSWSNVGTPTATVA